MHTASSSSTWSACIERRLGRNAATGAGDGHQLGFKEDIIDLGRKQVTKLVCRYVATLAREGWVGGVGWVAGFERRGCSSSVARWRCVERTGRAGSGSSISSSSASRGTHEQLAQNLLARAIDLGDNFFARANFNPENTSPTDHPTSEKLPLLPTRRVTARQIMHSDSGHLR